MSSFKGRMNEYRFLSLDRFDGDNLLSSMFFLSHAHEDHMGGLDSPRFLAHVASNNFKVFVHEVTYHLLLHDVRFRPLKPHLCPLSVSEPYILEVPGRAKSPKTEGQLITVTLLSAGHCPGSVMFLFEGDEGTVLYTGDIRLNGDDVRRMPALKTGDRPKEIRSVYFDSTFCTLDTVRICDRHVSLSAIVKLAQQTFMESPRKKILMYCAQKYGHEFLMCKLSAELNMKVHVTGSKFELYSKISDIANCVTNDATSTRLHACAFYTEENEEISVVSAGLTKNSATSKKYYKPSCIPTTCPHCNPYDDDVVVVKPSMLWFKQCRSANDVICFDKKSGIYRVQYSCHSSLKEVREILAYLRPRQIYPNVLPYGSKDYSEIYKLFTDILPSKIELLPDDDRRLSKKDEDNRGINVISVMEGRKRFLTACASASQTEISKKRKLKNDTKNGTPMKKNETWAEWMSCVDMSESGSESGGDISPLSVHKSVCRKYKIHAEKTEISRPPSVEIISVENGSVQINLCNENKDRATPFTLHLEEENASDVVENQNSITEEAPARILKMISRGTRKDSPVVINISDDENEKDASESPVLQEKPDPCTSYSDPDEDVMWLRQHASSKRNKGACQKTSCSKSAHVLFTV